MCSEYIRRYKLEVEIQDNGIIRDPFGWIIGRCNDEWFDTVVRHELPERTCHLEHVNGIDACSECGANIDTFRNYCQSCGAKVVE